MRSGGESYFWWSGKAFKLRRQHIVTWKDLETEYFGSENCRGEDLELGKVIKQKESLCGYRPVKEEEGDRREGRQDSS